MQQTQTNTAKRDANEFSGFLGFATVSSSSSNRGKILCPENEIKYGIRTSTQCSSTLQQPISWNHANKRDQSTNILEHHILNQHFFLITQPFLMI